MSASSLPADNGLAPAALSLTTLLAEWPDAFADRVLALDTLDAVVAWLHETPLAGAAVLRAPLTALRDLEAGPIDAPLLLAVGLRALGWQPRLWSVLSAGQGWLLVTAADEAGLVHIGGMVADELDEGRWLLASADNTADAVRAWLSAAHLPAPTQVQGPVVLSDRDGDQWPSEEDGVLGLLQTLDELPDSWPKLAD